MFLVIDEPVVVVVDLLVLAEGQSDPLSSVFIRSCLPQLPSDTDHAARLPADSHTEVIDPYSE